MVPVAVASVNAIRSASLPVGALSVTEKVSSLSSMMSLTVPTAKVAEVWPAGMVTVPERVAAATSASEAVPSRATAQSSASPPAGAACPAPRATLKLNAPPSAPLASSMDADAPRTTTTVYVRVLTRSSAVTSMVITFRPTINGTVNCSCTASRVTSSPPIVRVIWVSVRSASEGGWSFTVILAPSGAAFATGGSCAMAATCTEAVAAGTVAVYL